MILGTVAVAAAVLLWMGRAPSCACGHVILWHGGVNRGGNSQHISDWSTPSHVAHGFIFYARLHLVARRLRLWPRAAIARLPEAAWEVAENTPAVIQRYREATIALGYDGDSVITSVADIGWMIRDNLALNPLTLLWPLESVRAWQAGG